MFSLANFGIAATQLTGPQALPELKKRIKAGLRIYPDFPKVSSNCELTIRLRD